MICFLTSSPFLCDGDGLNPANGFTDKLAACLPQNSKALFICSDPYNRSRTEGFAWELRNCFENTGFYFNSFGVLDGENKADAPRLVAATDLIILAGGHVPTQNRFFAEIDLKSLLQGYKGVIMGISAGSMNSARLVYAHPELTGEAVDPAYQRFLPGLGLTKTMILPHYQALKDERLDGLRVMEDIAYKDSHGRCFLLLTDGSYLYIENGIESVSGEAYHLSDGQLAALHNQ